MGKRILVADDDALIRSILSDGLTAQGHEVSLAADGLEAWLQLQVAPPDYLVLDLIMPRLDGARLCRYVKADPRLAGIRVLVLSATAAEAGGQLRELGADRVLAKGGASDMVAELLRIIRAYEEGASPLLERTAPAGGVHPRRIVTELLAETAQLTAILTHLSEGILLLDADGRTLLVNPAGERLLGFSEQLLVGRRLVEAVGQPWGERLAAWLRDLKRDAARDAVGERVVHHARTLHATATALRDARHGAAYLLVLRDDSSYTQRVQELTTLMDLAVIFTSSAEADQLLAQVLERVQAAMQIDAGAILLVEPGTQSLIFRAAVGAYRDQVGRPRVPLGRGIAGWVCREGVPVIVPDAHQDPRFSPEVDGRTGFRAHSMLCVPLRIHDAAIGAIQVAHGQPARLFSPEDLNFLFAIAAQTSVALENARLFAELNDSYIRLRQAQDELVRAEKLRALGQMGTGIAHDLNNMLTAVLGQAELLKLHVSDPSLREALLTLETAAADGVEVVRRLRDFSRQRPADRLAPCDLGQRIQEALELTSPRWRDEAQRQGAPIEVRIDLPELPRILGHEGEVREVLMNLILNAADAMPRGGVLSFAARLSDPPQSPAPPLRWVELDVRDTGVGMTAEIQQRLYDPFFTTKGVRGTGLGLSVVYGIMERHGGSIRVATGPGQGTMFTLRFQAASSEPGAPALAPEAAVAPRRILFVDDDRSVRRTLAGLLRAAGHEVVEAESGTAGLDRLAESSPDLVITDLGMPDLTGWDVARAVKAHTPNLPVVLLTGWGDQQSVEDEGVGLVEQVLCKPVRLEHLLRVIQRLTTGSAAGSGSDR